MSRWLRMGLTDKLFIPFVGIVLLSVLVIVIFIMWMQNDEASDYADEFIKRTRQQWRSVTEILWANDNTAELKRLFQYAVENDPMLLNITLYDAENNVIASSSNIPYNNKSKFSQMTIALNNINGRTGSLVLSHAWVFVPKTSLEIISAIIIIGLSTIVLGGIVYMKVLNVILLRRIRSAVAVASAIADRDLTMRLDDSGEDEFAVLARAYNTMADNLAELVGTIQKIVNELDGRAARILTSADAQTTLAVRQSNQVSQITKTMEEIAEVTQRITQSSNDVVKIANDTKRDADRGVEATDLSRGRMDEISASNRERISQIRELNRRANQVGEVMEFLEQVADQTKLIAFNASIEAAGAGEMGKRFEIVAREIRRLAENVAESAGQITSRISDIQHAVDQLATASESDVNIVRSGAEAALLTVHSLHSIREGASNAFVKVEDISSAINIQNTATTQLLQSLRDIDAKSVALRDEMTALNAISQDMKEMSGELRNISSVFRLKQA